MADEVIGTARIDITASAEGVESAAAKAKTSIASLSKDAQAQYSRLSAAEKRRVDGLIRQADTVGMTRAQQIAYNAALKSSGPILDDLTRRLKASESAAKTAGNEFNKYGLTAKMEMAALRQVPAQITDIIVSLQGGQRPLTVLLQQGGQLKDVFGGIVPAATALGNAVAGMVNPFTLATGALAALAYGYLQGAKEGEEFRKTLIMTNGAIGVSVDGLMALAAQMDALSGTQSRAANVLNQFAGEAKVSAVDLRDYAQAAIQWSDATGQGVEEIVRNFSDLAKDPLDAIESLNDSMNFLTASTYSQIRTLVEAGKETEAANLAQKTYAETLRDRAPKMVENLGLVERAWRAIKNVGAEAIDGLMAIGRTQTIFEKIADEQGKLKAMQGLQSPFGGPSDAAIANQKQFIEGLYEQVRLEAAAARQQAEIRREERRDLELTRGRMDYLQEGRSREQQRLDDIAAENRKWESFSQGLEKGSKEYEALYETHQRNLEAIDKRYAEKRSGGISATQTELANLKARLVAEQARTEQLTSMGTALSKLNEGEKLALSYAEKSKLATDAKTKAALAEYEALAKRLGIQIRSNDEYEAELKTAESSLKKVQDESRAMKDRISVYGMSKGAIEEMAIARLREREALLAGTPGQEKLLELIRQEIAEREKLGGLLNQYEILEKQRKEWEQWQRDIGQIFDQVGQSLTDAIFDGGKSGLDLVKDFAKTLVLRVLVQPVMGALQGQVTQQLGGAFGYQDPSQQRGVSVDFNTLMGGGTGNSLASFGQLIGSSMVSEFGAGLTAGAGGALSDAGASALMGIGTNGSSSFAAGSSLGGVGLGSILGYGSAIFAATQGQYGSAVGTAIGTAIMPGVGTAIGGLLGSFADSMFGSEHDPRSNSASVYYRGQGAGLDPKEDYEDWAGDAAAQSMQALSQSVADTIDKTFAAVGSEIATHSVRAWYQTSENGKGGVQVGGVLTGTALDTQLADDFYRYLGPDSGTGRQFGDFLRGTGFGGTDITVENLQANLAAEANRAILMAFQEGIDAFPDVIQQQLASLDASSLNADQLAAAVSGIVGTINQVTALRDAMNALPFANLHDLSLDAAAGLLQLSGGLDSLLSAQQTYLQNFYSEAERQQIAVGNLTSALAAAGVEMPAIVGSADQMKAAYRALVDAQDLNTESGRQAYIALMSAAGAFADVAAYAGQAAQATQQAAAQAQQTAASVLQSALAAVMQAGQAEIARLQQTFTATDSALSAYRSAMQSMETEWRSLFSTIDSGIKTLRGGADDAFRAQYLQARAMISTALVTGQISDRDAMADAIKTAQQGVTDGVYASRFEQQRAYLTLAAELEGVRDIGETEIDVAKATLRQLEDQYAAIRGISVTASDSLLALQQQLLSAMHAEEDARAQISLIEQQLALAQSQYDALLGIKSGVADLATALAEFASALAAAKSAGVGSAAADSGSTQYMTEAQRALAYLNANPDVANAWQRDYGDMSFIEYAQIHYRDYGQYEGRSYDVGTSYVPHDMQASIHRGEIIIDPRSSDILRRYGIGVQGGGGSDSEQKELLRQIINRLDRLEAAGRATAVNTGRMDQRLDDAMQGGDALRTKEVATA